MKALSLLQPWASLVVMGLKTIETRNWSTAYRGELLIHASKGRRGEALVEDGPLASYIPDFRQLPFGAIIGKVALVDILPVEYLPFSVAEIHRQTLEHHAFGSVMGKYAWIFAEAQCFNKPLPTGGSLMIWDYKGPLPEDY